MSRWFVFIFVLVSSIFLSSCQLLAPKAENERGNSADSAFGGSSNNGASRGYGNSSIKNSMLEIERLQEGQRVADFQVKNLYLDGEGQAFAVGLIHQELKFRVFFTVFSTANQAAFWHQTIPTSNKGEPHALEHVVLGKGRRGKELATLYVKELGDHSASTHPRFTLYHFNVQTGANAFWQVYEKNLEMFFRPDFSDSDVAKEVYHFGVQSGAEGLSLIEKGTVYNEINSNIGLYDNWYAMLGRVFGGKHPAQWDAGGTPEGLRQVTAKDIRTYHKQNYRLDHGFGSIVVIPPGQSFEQSVDRLSQMVRRIKESVAPEVLLPRAKKTELPEPSTKITPEIFEYASENPSESGSALMAWEVIRGSDYKKEYKLGLFLLSFAQGSQSPLNQKLVDRYNEDKDFPMRGIWLGVNTDYGKDFVYGSLSGLTSSQVDRKTLESLWRWLRAEVEIVKEWPDNSEPLLRFNKRVLSVMKSMERQQRAMFDQPPGFGDRDAGDGWKSNFEYLDQIPGFRKSFVQSAIIKEISKEMESGKNIWRDLINNYRLTDKPYILARVPSKSKTEEVYRNLQSRLDKKKQQLISHFDVDDDQRALELFAESMREKQATKEQKFNFEFTSDPPMTFDEEIQWRNVLAWGVPLTVSEFATTSKISFGVSQSLRVIRPSDYIYLPLLFDLIDEVGLYEEGGQLLTPAELDEEMAREIYSVGFGVSINPKQNRSEFNVSMTATSIEEFKKSFNYWRRILKHNNLEKSNLKTIRDIIGRGLSSLSSARQSMPEHWLPSLSGAYFNQEDLLYLYFNSPYARLHLYRRYHWWLQEPPNEFENEKIESELKVVENLLQNSESLKDFLSRVEQVQWSEVGSKLVSEIKEVSFEFSPNYQDELRYVLQVIVDAWRTPPEETLKKLRQLQDRLFVQHEASGYLVGNKKNVAKALEVLRSEKRIFEKRKKFKIFKYEREKVVEDNLRRRISGWSNNYPQKIAFVDQQNSNGHVVVDSNFSGINRFSANDFFKAVAVNTMAGEGSHGIFMKTWQQGLAYNNSISIDPYYGEVSYYAEQSPNLRSTLNFVANELLGFTKKISEGHIDYSLSQFFSGSRLLASPISRAYNLYNDIKSGFEPERIMNFRKALLKIKARPDVLKQVRDFYQPVVSQVLFDRRFESIQKKHETRFFFVAPEEQVLELEQWYGAGPASITRIYPADFWIRKF